MLVMGTTKRPAHPLGEFVRAQQSIELHDLALAMNPFRLDGVQPRTLFREKATDDPHPTAALLHFSVVFAEPSPHLPGDVPACVVPDKKQGLLANSFEALAAPREKPRAYGAHRPAVDEPYPHVLEPWKVEAVAGYGLGVGVVLGDRLLDHARGLALLGEGAQSGQRHPAPPAFVLKAYCPLGVGRSHLHQSVAPPFFRSYKGSGEVIHRLARCQRMPRRRQSVARMVSPETLFSVRPSSKAASAAISRVHRLLSYPNSLGRAVEHPPQPLGRVRVEGGMHALWSRGASDERIQALLVEGADGVANRLGGAPETLGYLGRRAAAGAGEQYLAAAHHEGLPGAQPRFEAFALLFRQFPDKYWRFHKRNYSPSHTTLSEDALGGRCRCGETHDTVELVSSEATNGHKRKGEKKQAFFDPARDTVFYYRDLATKPLYAVVRIGGDKSKTFQAHKDGDDWYWGIPEDAPNVPYRITEVVQAIADGKDVHYFEGEPDANAARDLGLVATTNLRGAGNITADIVPYF